MSKKENAVQMIETPLKDLQIEKSARHCKVVREDGEVVFRTTNLQDAQVYVDLLEENRRLHHLIEARGIAPHRIYRCEGFDVNDEVVIVAKAGPESVVIRHLGDGREDVVDLDDVRPLADVDYMLGNSEAPVETVQVAIRLDRDSESALVRIHKTTEAARNTELFWRRASYEREKEDEVSAVWSDKDSLVFRDEVVIEE